MSTEKNQSAIAEVRDQLSIDYADGKYLNSATANLGLTRPVFGFSDDSWRAITKALALQFKQIRNKFHDILAIVLGPQTTEFATNTADLVVGTTAFQVEDSSRFPQLGTLIFDEGQATEETLEYCFIDRRTHTIFLETPTTQAHIAYTGGDVEAPLIDLVALPGDLVVQIHVTDARNITTVPVTAVIGRGTSSEEVVTITAVDTDNGQLTISPALVNTHITLKPSPIQDELAAAYLANSEFLTLADSSRFPDTGLVILASSSNSFLATGGTLTTVTYALNDLSDNRHGGHIIVFDGNITAGLAGVQRTVLDNDATTATMRTLPFVPAAGDTFSIRIVEKFTRNVSADNALQLSRDLADVTLPAGTEVELLKENATLAQAPVKVVGTGWDVIQVDPKNVEILIPGIEDTNTIRSASYLHPLPLAPFATTLAGIASIGDTSLSLTAPIAGLPESGQLVIDDGGGSEEFLGYSRQRIVDTFDATGATVNVIPVTAGGLTAAAHVGATVFIGNDMQAVNTSRTVIANTASTITVFAAGAGEPLTNEDFANLVDGLTEIWLYHETDVDLPHPVLIGHAALETVDYEQTIVVVGASSTQGGDIWADDNTFPGGYLYDISQDAPAVAAAITTLDDPRAGPTFIVVDSFVTRTILEVVDATLFPIGAVSPFTAVLGRGSGNRETLTVSDVNLKQRTSTTVAAPGSSATDTIIPVTALAGGGTADDFPNGRGYRVLLDKGGANEEVIYVTGTLTGPDRLVCDPAVEPHIAGETVELMADLITVNPLDDNHIGSVSFSERFARWPGGPDITLSVLATVGDTSIEVTSTVDFPVTGNLRVGGDTYVYVTGGATTFNISDPGGIRLAASFGDPVVLLASQQTPELLEVEYDTLEVVSTVGFPTAGGDVLLNFGTGVLSAESTLVLTVVPPISTIDLVDTSGFPTTSYPYEILINPGGGEQEERVLVTFNDTGLNRLTLDSATTIGHLGPILGAGNVGTKVSFTSGLTEKVSFTEVDGATTLRSSTPFVLQSNHSTTETVIQSPGLSSPGTDGYGFPFRMPTDLLFRIQFLFDLIRAAGVQVTVIEQR